MVAENNLAELKNKIFDQGQIGMASYHFLETGPYICYSSQIWKLDDGVSYPPHEKMFEDYTYDADSRTFKGDITWAPITFSGNNRWEYTIVFDEEFTKISGGTVECYSTTGEKDTIYFG